MRLFLTKKAGTAAISARFNSFAFSNCTPRHTRHVSCTAAVAIKQARCRLAIKGDPKSPQSPEIPAVHKPSLEKTITKSCKDYTYDLEDLVCTCVCMAVKTQALCVNCLEANHSQVMHARIDTDVRKGSFRFQANSQRGQTV